MGSRESLGNWLKLYYVGLFAAMSGAMAELLIVQGYESCFNLISRYAMQIFGELTIYGPLLGAWVGYKESSRIKGALFPFTLFFLGSLPSMAYICVQFFKLTQEEQQKDPIYYVLAKRVNRGNPKGPSVMAARIICCILIVHMIGIMMYSIFVDTIYVVPNINKCLVSNVIDIHVHYAAISGIVNAGEINTFYSRTMVQSLLTIITLAFVRFSPGWVAYKESTWTSAFCWVLFVMTFRGLAVVIFVLKQLLLLSPDQPVSLILFNNKNRDLHTTDPLLMVHPVED